MFFWTYCWLSAHSLSIRPSFSLYKCKREKQSKRCIYTKINSLACIILFTNLTKHILYKQILYWRMGIDNENFTSFTMFHYSTIYLLAIHQLIRVGLLAILNSSKQWLKLFNSFSPYSVHWILTTLDQKWIFYDEFIKISDENENILKKLFYFYFLLFYLSCVRTSSYIYMVCVFLSLTCVKSHAVVHVYGVCFFSMTRVKFLVHRQYPCVLKYVKREL